MQLKSGSSLASRVMSPSGSLASIAVAGITWATFKRKRENIHLTNRPLGVEVANEVKILPKEKRFSIEVCEAKHMRIDERLAALDSYAHQEVERIHDKIDLVDRRAADKLQASIDSVNATIRDMPHQIIKLLRATGQLKDHHD